MFQDRIAERAIQGGNPMSESALDWLLDQFGTIPCHCDGDNFSYSVTIPEREGRRLVAARAELVGLRVAARAELVGLQNNDVVAFVVTTLLKHCDFLCLQMEHAAGDIDTATLDAEIKKKGYLTHDEPTEALLQERVRMLLQKVPEVKWDLTKLFEALNCELDALQSAVLVVCSEMKHPGIKQDDGS